MGQNNRQRRAAKARTRKATGRQRPGPAQWVTPMAPHTDADEAMLLVVEAVRAVERGWPEAAVARLVGFCDSTALRRVTSRALTQCLHGELTHAWRHGWQPADLLRLAGRRLSGAEVAVLGDAIVEDLAGYAVASVDPRWWGQLQDAGATRWWSRDTEHLIARATVLPGGWAALCGAAVTVISFCAGLPALEVIGPRPGEAVPAPVRDDGDRPDVDQRILSKVRQLLAKAESTTFEAEAETFTAGAQAMMARHSIDAAMLQAASRRSSDPEARRIGIDRPYESPKAMLLSAVAEANRCRTVWAQHLGFTTVLGFAPDLEAVETLFTSLLVQATHSLNREGTRRTASGRSRTRSFRSSFLTSYAARIGERLRDVTQAETAAATARDDEQGVHPAGRHTTGVLVRVLAARSAAVDEAVDAMFPELVSRGVTGPQDLEGWVSGRAAADRAALDHRPGVSGVPVSGTG